MTGRSRNTLTEREREKETPHTMSVDNQNEIVYLTTEPIVYPMAESINFVSDKDFPPPVLSQSSRIASSDFWTSTEVITNIILAGKRKKREIQCY